MGKSSRSATRKSDAKLEKKLEFYSKVRDKVASLSAQKNIVKKRKLRPRQKKLKAYNLATLSESLPELKTSSQPTPDVELKVNCKSRQNLVVKEGDRMRAILGHPAFQSDPLATIHEHLKNTQPVSDEKPDRKNKKRKKLKRAKKSKAGPQSMES